VTQTNDERDFRMIRWGIPLVVAVGVPTEIAEHPRFWYIAVGLAVFLLIGYVQILRFEREKKGLRPSRRAARSPNRRPGGPPPGG
jgi:hypothetical protein